MNEGEISRLDNASGQDDVTSRERRIGKVQGDRSRLCEGLYAYNSQPPLREDACPHTKIHHEEEVREND